MKVLYLIDTLQGYGAEKSLCNIIIRFTKVTPIVVHIYQGDDLKNFLQENNVLVYSLELPKGNSFSTAVKHLEEIISKEKPEIIHSTLFRSDMVGRKLKTLYPDITLVGSFVSNSYSKRRYSQLSMLSKLKLFYTQMRDYKTAETVDYFISNSNAIKTTNARALGIANNKIFTIPRGRDVKNLNRKDAIPKGLHKKLKKQIFLNVGRLEPNKGQLDLIKAFDKVQKISDQDLTLLIAGEGSYRRDLTATIKKFELEEKIILLGYREDIPELLNFADYFIFPSHYEGLPGSLVEAILSRTPVIISNIPENLECLPKSSTLTFEPGNISEIANMMLDALTVQNWSEKVEEAYNFALSKFEITRVSKRYEDFYINIVKMD